MRHHSDGCQEQACEYPPGAHAPAEHQDETRWPQQVELLLLRQRPVKTNAGDRRVMEEVGEVLDVEERETPESACQPM